MHKWVLLLLFMPIFTPFTLGQTTVNVTANLQDTFGANVVSKAKVCFSLIDGAGNPIPDPRTTSGLLISTDSRCVTPNASGVISTTLVPNNVIVPSGTQYAVAEYFQGSYVHGDNFTFDSGTPSYNLNTMAPNVPSTVTPVGFQAVLINPVASQTIVQPNGTSFTIQGAPVTSGSYISTVSTGTPPLQVASTTLVTNLNTDFLGGHHASDFTHKIVAFRIGSDSSTSTLADTDDEADIFTNTWTSAFVISKVSCRSDAGTPTIQIQRDDGSPANILSSDLTCTSSGANTTTFVTGENNIDVSQAISFEVISSGGTAKRVAVTIEGDIQ